MKQKKLHINNSEKNRILEMYNLMNNKNILLEVTGLSILPDFQNSFDVIRLVSPNNDIIAFPQADTIPSVDDDGFPTNGDFATRSGQSVICNLGNSQYLILGQIGRLVDRGSLRSMTINNILPMAMIIVSKKGISDRGSRPSAGRAIRYLNTYNNTNNFIQIIVDAIDHMGGTNWHNWGKTNILKAYKLASQLNVVPQLNDYITFRNLMYEPLNKVRPGSFKSVEGGVEPDDTVKGEFKIYDLL